jgi:general secretion pathway protein D
VSDAERVPRLSIDDGASVLPPRPGPVTQAPLALDMVPAGRAYVVHGQRSPTGTPSPKPAVAGAGGTFVLNFDNADIRDVAKAVLGDMLQLGYAIAPAVQGNISLHTATPLPRDAVLPAFEDALALAGAALVPNGDGFDIVPLQGAARTSGRSSSGQAGYRVEIVPLHYVSAADMQHLIEPLVAAGTIVQTDTQRNLLVVGGSSTELARVMQTIGLFDVDWLRHQSFGLFPLQYSQAKAVAADLQAMVAGGPMASLVRILPIEHLNAILVVSSRAGYVDDLRGWVEKFDRGRDTAAPRVFVYHVQHGRAADIAATLSRALGSRRGDGGGAPETGGLQEAAAAPAAGANPLLGGLTAGGLSQGGAANDTPFGDVRITADETNNALLIVTTAEKYRLVEQALQQLDAVPLQVMLEACVAEVHLTNQLQYGLQYYFRNGNFSLLRSAVVPASLAADTGGLSLLFSQGNSIQAVLDLIAMLTKVTVISAPRVMVLMHPLISVKQLSMEKNRMI